MTIYYGNCVYNNTEYKKVKQMKCDVIWILYRKLKIFMFPILTSHVKIQQK